MFLNWGFKTIFPHSEFLNNNGRPCNVLDQLQREMKMAARNQQVFLLFEAEGALLSDCTAQDGSVLVTISAELLRSRKFPG